MRAGAAGASVPAMAMSRPSAGATALLAALALGAAGCARMPGGGAGAPQGVIDVGSVTPEAAAGIVAEAGRAAPLPADRRTAEDFDTTTEQERAVAVAAAAQEAPERPLGATIAALGDAADPGLWLETPLVSEAGPGRVAYPPAGTSVLVELRPSGGAAGSGSRASLAALRLLEAPLAGLTEVEVFAR